MVGGVDIELERREGGREGRILDEEAEGGREGR